MGTFLLIIFVVFFVIPLLRVVTTVYKARRTMRDAMRSMYEAQQGQRAQGAEPHRRKAGWTSPIMRRKKITKDVGEYVKFEELPADPDTPADGYTRATYTRTESQITDVEWEDIK